MCAFSTQKRNPERHAARLFCLEMSGDICLSKCLFLKMPLQMPFEMSLEMPLVSPPG